MAASTRAQHAIRLLVLLASAGETTTPSDPEDCVRVIRSELKLQALDFWLRNPDYLADELINAVQERGSSRDLLEVAATMIDSEEPSLRHCPMPRWFYGAYEPLDDAMSLLEVHGLATTRRSGAPGAVRRSQFYLTALGQSAADEIASDVTPLQWYALQAAWVVLAASDDLGSTLKQRQYAQAEYAGTELGSTIGTIREHVRGRLRTAMETAV